MEATTHTVTSRFDPSNKYVINRELEVRDEEELEAQSPFEFKVCVKDGAVIKYVEGNCRGGSVLSIYVVVGLKKSVEGTMASVYPIYLVPYQEETSSTEDEEEVSDIVQIGVFEINTTDAPDLLPDSAIDDAEPIFYPNITSDILQFGSEQHSIKDASSKEKNVTPMSPQTKEKSLMESEAYLKRPAKARRNDEWIQKFMKNENFDIQNTIDDGNCFFDTLHKAFDTVGKSVSIEEMRTLVAENTSVDSMLQYVQLYFMYKPLYDDAVERKKKLKKLPRGEQKAINDEIKEYAELLEEVVFIKPILPMSDTGHRPPDSDEEIQEMFGKFKEILKSCDFWANDSTVVLLEKALNIKIILFSEEIFLGKDFDGVIQCGLPIELDSQTDVFTPDYYIMANYTGNHYQLITYHDRGAFTFPELPYDVKLLIAKACMEHRGGTYNDIPEFREFMAEQNIVIPPAESSTTYDSDIEESESGDDIVKPIFQFYSKSADKPKPGEGSGERIDPMDVVKYVDLAKIKSWRRKLSNFWPAPFKLDGRRWASVEHYYQASKFKKSNPTFYASFSLDSGSDLSKDPLKAKKAGGKTKTPLRPSAVTIDSDFFDGAHEKAMFDAQKAKFTQNPDMTDLLIKTGNAILNHFSRGQPPIMFKHLMNIRASLQKSLQ